MSSLRAPIFLKRHFVAKSYFIFLKARPRSNFKCFQYQFEPQWKDDRKTSYQVKQILSLLCKLVSLILD